MGQWVRVDGKSNTKWLVLYFVNLNDAKMGRQNNCMMFQLILELETKGSTEFPNGLREKKNPQIALQLDLNAILYSLPLTKILNLISSRSQK